MAYVDVSDNVARTRRARLAVAAAGPLATVAFAGVVALGTLVAGPVLGGALWLFALSSYVSVLQNLNPLIELDGYYILVHWLDRPNLRSRSLAWLRDEGRHTILHPSRVRGHGFEAGYAVASISYLIGSAVLVVVLYRAVLEGWVARWLPTGVATALGWFVAGRSCCSCSPASPGTYERLRVAAGKPSAHMTVSLGLRRQRFLDRDRAGHGAR